MLYVIGNGREEKNLFNSTTLLTMTCAMLGVICVGLVGSWAKSPAAATGSSSSTSSSSITPSASVSTVTSTYLGLPDSSNPLAWHAVLMVGGFFFSQVLAVLSWRMFPIPSNQKLFHVCWNTLALLMMALGLVYIDSYKDKNSESRLTSVHSWLGDYQ